MNSEKELLQDFAKAISIPLYNTDGIKWPIRSGLIINPVMDKYAIEYMSHIDFLINSVEPKQWHTAFYNVLGLWRFSHHIVNGLLKANCRNEDIAKKIIQLMKVIERIAPQDRQCNGKHLVLDNREISVIMNYHYYTQKKSIALLLKLSALLWAYSDSLYFQGREICCEYHGLYEYDRNNKVLIRDFCNFEPKDLWAELQLNIKYRRIQIITIHDDSLDVYMDVYNNSNVISGDFESSVHSGMLLVDGVCVTEDFLLSMISYFSVKLEEIVKYVSNMNSFELYKKYLDIFWYRKKPLAVLSHNSWRPPHEIYDIVFKHKIKQQIQNPYSKQGIKEIKKKYDFSNYLN